MIAFENCEDLLISITQIGRPQLVNQSYRLAIINALAILEHIYEEELDENIENLYTVRVMHIEIHGNQQTVVFSGINVDRTIEPGRIVYQGPVVESAVYDVYGRPRCEVHFPRNPTTPNPSYLRTENLALQIEIDKRIDPCDKYVHGGHSDGAFSHPLKVMINALSIFDHDLNEEYFENRNSPNSILKFITNQNGLTAVTFNGELKRVTEHAQPRHYYDINPICREYGCLNMNTP